MCIRDRPKISLFLSLSLIPLLILIPFEKRLEPLSIKTVIYDHLVTLIYSASFLLSAKLEVLDLILFIITHGIFIAMEAGGILCSNLVNISTSRSKP